MRRLREYGQLTAQGNFYLRTLAGARLPRTILPVFWLVAKAPKSLVWRSRIL
jgi:hypothetical protein